ncbi:MAG: HK97 family phage prohead protease [Bacteroidota bacterium]
MEKQLNSKIQTRGALLRSDSVNEEERTAEFVISTEAVDSYGTVFKLDGWDLKRYEKNPIVLYQHNSHSSDPDLVIGTAKIKKEDGRLIGTVTFESAEDNPLAEKVFRKVKNNILRGASISARPSEGRMGDKEKGEDPEVFYFTRQELTEWSIVTIPSNDEALKRNAEAIEKLKTDLINVESEEINPKEGEKRTLSTHDAQLIINQNSYQE